MSVRAPVAFDTWADQGQRRQLHLDDGGLLLNLNPLKGPTNYFVLWLFSPYLKNNVMIYPHNNAVSKGDEQDLGEDRNLQVNNETSVKFRPLIYIWIILR